MSLLHNPPFKVRDIEQEMQIKKLNEQCERESKQRMKSAMEQGEKLAGGSEWMHKSSGKLYKIVCVTNLTATKPEFQPQVVYEDEEFSIWSRPLSEWESKFKYIRPVG